MEVFILTLLLCLSNADVFFNLEDNSTETNIEDEPPYNIHKWIKELQLQTCAIVAIGLKYFALFVENITESKNGTINSTKLFLGICHQTTLEQWDFCSENLAKKRKHKCRFKPKTGIYQSRVHRRFCDFNIMVKNKDCGCVPSILEHEMYKVRGFPTCYLPPLPHALCKYNVCGLSKCRPLTVEPSVHSVDCDPDCTAGNPFCEGPLYRSSSPPKIHSQWSKWSHLETDVDAKGETRPSRSSSMESNSKKRRSVATCINKYTRKADLDCLGPGTGCCPENAVNCTCNTYEEGGGLKVERSYYYKRKRKRLTRNLPSRRNNHKRKSARLLRDTDDDMEDDNDENEDLDEDIVLEEDTTETTATTTETLEKEELDEQVKNNLEEEVKAISANNTLTNQNEGNTAGAPKHIFLLLFVLIIVTNIFISNKR